LLSRKIVNDATVSAYAANNRIITAHDKCGQACFQVPQLGKLGPNCFKLYFRRIPHLATFPISIVERRNQVPYLFYGEANIATTPNESESFEVCGTVMEAGTRSSASGRKQADCQLGGQFQSGQLL